MRHFFFSVMIEQHNGYRRALNYTVSSERHPSMTDLFSIVGDSEKKPFKDIVLLSVSELSQEDYEAFTT